MSTDAKPKSKRASAHFILVQSLCWVFALMRVCLTQQLSAFGRRLRHRRARFAPFIFHRFACLTMVMVMSIQGALTSPPVSRAAARAVSATAMGYGQDAQFWWHSSGWAARVERLRNEYLPNIGATTQRRGWDGKGAPRRSRPAPPDVETRQDRERRIARIGIFPGDRVEIKTGEQVIFNAIAFDPAGNVVNGLEVKWSALHEEKNHPLTITAPGTFVSAVPGRFIVTAEIAGRKEQVKVTVTGEARRPGLKSRSEASKSSRESRRIGSLRAPVSGDQKRIARRGKRAGTPTLPGPLRAASTPMAASSAMFIDGDSEGWHSGNHGSAYANENKVGYLPGQAIDGGAGSSNFQFSAPAVALDGRGIDLNLLLNYNSRVWHKAGSEMTFNIDRTAIAGWTLGFGKIVMAGDTYMLIDGNGAHHPYQGALRRGFPAPASSLQTFEGHTTDDFTNYYAEGYQEQFNSGGRNMIMAWAVMSDGTRIEYGAPANYAMYPVKITDKNGNFITITYCNNQGPNIQTITEPGGRVILFHYDVFGLLTAITVPGLGGGQRVAVRLQYQWLTLSNAGPNYGFAGWLRTKVRQGTVPVLKVIYYPGTNTGYWFGDDAYSSYGMLCKLSERHGMTFDNAPLNEQGNIGAGLMSRETVYNYPQSGGSYSDMPTYTRMTEDWAGRMTDSAPGTQFSVIDNSNGTRTTRITKPNGSQLEQITDNNQSSPTYGQLLEDALYQDSSQSVVLSRSKAFWEIGAYNALRPTRTEETDQRGQTRVTTYSYDPAYGSLYNSVTDKRVFGYSGELLRHDHIEYLNTPNYNGSLQNSGTLWWKQGGALFGVPVWSGPHIFNLVSVTEVYGAAGERLSRAEMKYDGAALIDNPGIVQHNSWYNPHTPDQVVCEQVPNPNDQDCMECPPPIECPFDDGFCSSIEQCAYYPQYDPKTLYRGNVTEIKRYADAVDLNQETASVETLTYDVAGNQREKTTFCRDKTSYTYTANTQYAWLESQTTGALSDPSKQNSSSAAYDYNTGLVTTSTDANGRVSQTIYDQSTLRPVYEYSPTGAYQHHIYDDLNLSISDFVYEAGQSDGNFASRSDKHIDGMGRVIKEVAFGKDYAPDVVETKFDNMGRVWQNTRPYRSGVETPQWGTVTYDALDRPIQHISPDGSVVTKAYNQSPDPPGASGQPGQTVKLIDPWRRERWLRFDANDRLVEVAEPNPGGDGSLSGGAMYTTYSYNARDHLIQVDQGEQMRRFGYDGLVG